jgi:SAM-dependent methyltransferase
MTEDSRTRGDHGDAFLRLADEWDRRYASVERVFRPEPDETLVELVSLLAPGNAVDLGAGEGRNSLWLASKGWHVVAVDASSVALECLGHLAAADGLVVDAVHADVAGYLDSIEVNTIDLVVLAYVHPPWQLRVQLIAAAARIVSPGGHLFVVGHHLSSFGVAGPPDASRLYREDELLMAVGSLDVLRMVRRQGASDVAEPGTDLVLWAQAPVSSRSERRPLNERHP